MNTLDRDAKLTAYALDDPGLTAAERAVIADYLETDADARRSVAETKQLAALLAAGLKAEADAAPAGVVTVPAAKPRTGGFKWTMAALAAAVLLAVGGVGYSVYPRGDARDRTSASTVTGPTRFEHEPAQPATIGEAPKDAPDINGRVEVTDGTTPDSDTTLRLKTAEAKGDADKNQVRGMMTDNATRLRSGTKRDEMKGKAPAAPTPLAPPSGPPVAGQSVVQRLQSTDRRDRFAGRVPYSDEAKPAGGEKPLAEAEKLAKDWSEVRQKEEKLKQLEDRPALGAFYAFPTRDAFPPLVENPFVAVEGQSALSTFGLDVDTASYSIVRKFLAAGQLPPKDAVRLEEMVNYFPYRDAGPDGDEPYTCRVELTTCPWQPRHHLARIAVKAKPVAPDKRPASNLVFLIDVSGSMNEPNKLPLVKTSLKMLVNALNENDRVAMVVYAGQAGLVLDSTNAAKKDAILSALDRLEAGGSTNGAGGLRQAYDVAVANFVKGGTNRVILCTDGDWNVGTTSTQDLISLVEEKRKTGVFLSVLGYGMGNLRDEMMVNLAGKGNGNYAYIDTAREANKALVEQIGGTLVTVAKDVKVQVEFNPAAIQSYRLLGYEKRILAAQDFADDTKDAGEMGAGHVVTALYELVPVGAAAPAAAPAGDGLRYQPDAKKAAPAAGGVAMKADEAFLVKMRHKKPDADRSTLREMPVRNDVKPYDKAGEDFRFAASVAGFALLLRDSPHKGGANFGLIQELAESAKGYDPGGYRTEFVEMVKRAKQISGK